MNRDKFLCAVIGSQNTGKSTFISDVIEKYQDNQVFEPFVTDPIDYRKVIEEKHLTINREGNIESQRVIFDCLSNQVISAIRNPNIKNVIFDRCPLDSLVYTMYLYDMQKGGVTKDHIDQMISEMKRFIRLYDAVIYIPLEKCNNVKVVDDKFRDTDIEYRCYVDRLFKNAISTLENIDREKIIEIYGDRKERVTQFYEKVHQYFVLKPTW